MSPLAFRFDYGRESPVVSSLTFGFLGHLWPCRPCPSALSAMFGYVDLGLRLWHEDRPFCPWPSALDAKTESQTMSSLAFRFALPTISALFSYFSFGAAIRRFHDAGPCIRAASRQTAVSRRHSAFSRRQTAVSCRLSAFSRRQTAVSCRSSAFLRRRSALLWFLILFCFYSLYPPPPCFPISYLKTLENELP